MENVKITTYIPPELEIIIYECSDIITTSNNNDYYVPDNNVDDSW